MTLSSNSSGFSQKVLECLSLKTGKAKSTFMEIILKEQYPSIYPLVKRGGEQ